MGQDLPCAARGKTQQENCRSGNVSVGHGPGQIGKGGCHDFLVPAGGIFDNGERRFSACAVHQQTPGQEGGCLDAHIDGGGAAGLGEGAPILLGKTADIVGRQNAKGRVAAPAGE